MLKYSAKRLFLKSMYICMYVYLYTHIYVCMYVYTYMCVYIFTYIYLNRLGVIKVSE